MQFAPGSFQARRGLNHLGMLGFIYLAELGMLHFNAEQLRIQLVDDRIQNDRTGIQDIELGARGRVQFVELGIDFQPAVAGLDIGIVEVRDFLSYHFLLA